MVDYSRHKHISSEFNPWDLHLREVFEYTELIFLFVKRGFQVSYKQTILGPLWLFINPIVTSFFYVILFGNIAKLSTEGAPQILFYLTSTALWSFFSGNLSSNTSVFIGNAGIFSKVYFPRLVMPLTTLLGSIVKLGIQMILVLVLLVYYCWQGAIHPHWGEWLLIPLVLLNLGLLGIGLGIIFSSMTTKYRDLSGVISFGIGLWMYATPVVYPLSQVGGGWIRTLLVFNPVTAPVELFRHAVLGNGTVMIGGLLYSWVVTLFFLIAGIFIFNKVERNFIDTI